MKGILLDTNCNKKKKKTFLETDKSHSTFDNHKKSNRFSRIIKKIFRKKRTLYTKNVESEREKEIIRNTKATLLIDQIKKKEFNEFIDLETIKEFWLYSLLMYPSWILNSIKFTSGNKAFFDGNYDLKKLFPHFEYLIKKNSITAKFPSYSLIYDKKKHRLILIVRGSAELKDWIINLSCTKKINQNSSFHNGMYESANYIWNDIIEKVMIYLKLKKNDESITIHCCGHSLGAGIAAILVIKFKYIYQYVYGWCFGAPSVCDIYTSSKYKDCIMSFIYGRDVVPRLSLSSVENTLKIFEMFYNHHDNPSLDEFDLEKLEEHLSFIIKKYKSYIYDDSNNFETPNTLGPNLFNVNSNIGNSLFANIYEFSKVFDQSELFQKFNSVFKILNFLKASVENSETNYEKNLDEKNDSYDEEMMVEYSILKSKKLNKVADESNEHSLDNFYFQKAQKIYEIMYYIQYNMLKDDLFPVGKIICIIPKQEFSKYNDILDSHSNHPDYFFADVSEYPLECKIPFYSIKTISDHLISSYNKIFEKVVIQ